MIKASFGRRVAAAILDSIIVNIFVQLLVSGFVILYYSGGTSSRNSDIDVMITSIVGFVIGCAVAWMYYITIPVAYKGQTWGKKWMHISVVKQDGSEVTTGTMFFREFIGKLCSTLILYIGYLMALSDSRKALHDRMADTMVIKILQPGEALPNSTQ